ncbi:radical SAM protein [Sedimentibacter sp. zth1]|uniref:radical SAM/SPASM domain-containing protein n=1 Tax=Sedimentibacter sp. zth1 TaxID=2816908 RepID=UPI001A92CDD4|nr:radical SAM/SPASM domain-containing protein [Sedimentibacter sp. zth1]QSX05399.1 radical SAM protein [Sedimentibacter sp. zth1]
MKFRTLTLLITYKCNAECDICVFCCNKQKNDKMNLDDAYRYIDEAFEIESFENLAISGGEPFLFFEDLIKICKKAHKKNIPITISTNGFWASSIEKTSEIIEQLILLGVTSLYISVDQFHAEYVPYDCIKNILVVSKKLKIRIDLHSIITKNSLKLKHIVGKLEDEIMNYKIVQLPCVACGRAKEKIDENDFIYQDSIPVYKCTYLNTLVIDSYGKAYPCCGVTNRSKYFLFDNANKHSIEEIISFYNNNIYLKLLETYGTGWFLENIKKYKLDVKLKNKYTNVCELCGDLFSDDNDIEIYRAAINNEKQKMINKHELVCK